ncbi:MAG: response regulator [Fibrobacteria bacterium]|nr:response regulator [Fibrobacteria bacterium]
MPKKILLVDDEPDILMTVKKRLQISGYEVDTAENGREALEKVKTYEPDLVVLDVMMPEINGYEVCRTLRESPETQNLPIIMLTAKAQNFDKFWGQEVGASKYLTKPFDDKELVKSVGELLGTG